MKPYEISLKKKTFSGLLFIKVETLGSPVDKMETLLCHGCLLCPVPTQTSVIGTKIH